MDGRDRSGPRWLAPEVICNDLFAGPGPLSGSAAALAPSGAEILQRCPLSHQLLVADQAIAGVLIRLNPVLVAQGGELLPQGIEDGVVVVQGSGTNLETLTESKDRSHD